MKKALAPLLVATAALNVSAASHTELNEEGIYTVVEQFRTSIINKDKETFLTLFYNDNIPWIGVFNQKTLQERRLYKADHPKIDGGSHLEFIDKISGNPQRIEEKFWDLDIQTDQDIASVHFKYTFHIGDYTQNWGEESWQLVNTESGWKINSVIYSMTYNTQP